jgi:hypothetical protein
MLAAGDTFRAGAIQQLKVWGERVGVDVMSQNEGCRRPAVSQIKISMPLLFAALIASYITAAGSEPSVGSSLPS